MTFNRHILESNRKLTTTNILSKKTPIAENLSGNDIKYLRKKYNLTQKELADALGLQKFGDRTIRRWEAEETHPSKLEQSSIQSFFNSLKNPPFIISENLPFKMIDLFAGIGGTRLGFQLTNEVETVFTSEWDKFAQKTYITNFGDTPEGDITQIDENTIPDHDILVAGFPCQAFSQAGKRLGFEDTRGTLFFDVARIIKAKRPKAFLLENVKNLKTHDKGKTYKIIISTLEDLGYSTSTVLFKARDFGVPQNRERIYIVGFDKTCVNNFSEFRFPEPFHVETKLGNILQTDVDEKYTISDKLWEGHQRRKAEHKTKGNGFGYSLFNVDSPYTNTLSARYYKDGSEILIEQKGKNPRKITPREAARLQGFPEEFIIPVSDTQAYKQFGNSVCVPAIHEIAKQILAVLKNS
ncbi:TPA: DNA (cytosine-5-)-methyltransferase [Streptococcus agalactiae]|nr:DNA (cytosine-5-)-methyltransferase [Streptococcus agalactiae]HEN0966990.1 DNA (cytosine-5-)-methyltransferase [Streptococcus agalactiae]HEN0985845.1 DNA (cytosine-5-)-methyltransferase [Streptococcus agalactiae]